MWLIYLAVSFFIGGAIFLGWFACGYFVKEYGRKIKYNWRLKSHLHVVSIAPDSTYHNQKNFLEIHLYKEQKKWLEDNCAGRWMVDIKLKEIENPFDMIQVHFKDEDMAAAFKLRWL